MNPIIAEMGRLFPDHTLTRAQVRAAERADNPADVAASLKVQARDIRKMFDDRLNDIVLLLQAARQLTDQQVDALFGI